MILKSSMSRKTSVAVPFGFAFRKRRKRSIRATRPLRFRSPVSGSVSAMVRSRLRWEIMVRRKAKLADRSSTNRPPMMLAAMLSRLSPI